MKLLDSALRYVRKGKSILPLHGIQEDGSCTCGRADCSSPGKHPRISNGVKGASSDAEQIRAWWERWPDANIGRTTGSGEGVIDVDMPDGPESIARLREEGKDIPETLTQQTGGGGVQYFLKFPDDVPLKNIVGLREGVDFKGKNAYVVVPPSLHQTGQRYRWTAIKPIAPAPDWLRDLLAEHSNGSSRRKADEIPDEIPAGKRNATLASLAGSMRNRGASEAAIQAALLKQNASCCVPPLSVEEVAGIAASISNYPPGTSTQTGSKKKSKQAKILVELAQKAGLELFRDGEDIAWGTFPVGAHLENHSLSSRQSRLWLMRLFYKVEDKPPAKQALQDAIHRHATA